MCGRRPERGDWDSGSPFLKKGRPYTHILFPSFHNVRQPSVIADVRSSRGPDDTVSPPPRTRHDWGDRGGSCNRHKSPANRRVDSPSSHRLGEEGSCGGKGRDGSGRGAEVEVVTGNRDRRAGRRQVSWHESAARSGRVGRVPGATRNRQET